MKAKIFSGATVAVAAMGLALAGATPAAAKHHKHHRHHHHAEKHKCSAKASCSGKSMENGGAPAGEPK